MTSSGLHVHQIMVDGGRLSATVADHHGRRLTLDVDPDDHPALEAAWDAFCVAIVAATETVMLDLLGAAGRDVTPDDLGTDDWMPSVLPCRVCGNAVQVDTPPATLEDRAAALRTTYCPEHAPQT